MGRLSPVFIEKQNLLKKYLKGSVGRKKLVLFGSLNKEDSTKEADN